MVSVIADFAADYLAACIRHPLIKDWHSIRYLTDRFFFYNRDQESIDVGGEAALNADLEQLQAFKQLRRIPPGYAKSSGERARREERMRRFPSFFAETNQFAPFHSQIRGPESAVRSILLEFDSIRETGSKRGSKFGHIQARPFLPDLVIAGLIQNILYYNPGPYRWSDLCSPVLTMIRDIHFRGAEIAATTKENLNFMREKRTYSPNDPGSPLISLTEKIRIKTPILASQTGDFSEVNSPRWWPALYPRNQEEKDEQFDLWLDTNYSEKWFINATANLQRLLKAEDDSENQVIAGSPANGVKRGMWIHSKHLKHSEKPLSTKFVTIQLVTKEVTNLLHSSNLEDHHDRHRLMQLGSELRYLSDEIERRLKDTEYKGDD